MVLCISIVVSDHEKCETDVRSLKLVPASLNAAGIFHKFPEAAQPWISSLAGQVNRPLEQAKQIPL